MGVRLSSLFLGISFLPFLKTGVTLAFLEFSGTSPVLQELSKMESGLAITSVILLSTQGYIPLGPMDLCVQFA